MFSLRTLFSNKTKNTLTAPQQKSVLEIFKNSDIDFIIREIDFDEKIRSDKNLVIIGDVHIGAHIKSRKSIMLAKVENNYLTFNGVAPNVKITAGEDIYLHSAGPGCILNARRNVFTGSKIIAELTDTQIDALNYVDGTRNALGDDWPFNYQTAGGVGASTTVLAGGDFYADNIGDSCTIKVTGKTTTRHHGGYGYATDNPPDWWPNAEAEWKHGENFADNYGTVEKQRVLGGPQ